LARGTGKAGGVGKNALNKTPIRQASSKQEGLEGNTSIYQ